MIYVLSGSISSDPYFDEEKWPTQLEMTTL